MLMFDRESEAEVSAAGYLMKEEGRKPANPEVNALMIANNKLIYVRMCVCCVCLFYLSVCPFVHPSISFFHNSVLIIFALF